MSEDNSGASPRLVVFGGVSLEGTMLGDTQVLATTSSAPSWQPLATTSTPPPTSKHAMANLPPFGVVMFGGQTDPTTLTAATWIFHGDSWSQVGGSTAPTPRTGHAMALDESRNRIVLYGGKDANNVLLSDTWEFDGSSWSLIAATSAPGPLAGHSMAFQASTASIILVNNTTGWGSSTPNPSWRYAGASQTWTSFPGIPSPSAPFGPAGGWRVVRCPGSNTVCVLGGLADMPVMSAKLIGSTWYAMAFPYHRSDFQVAYDPASDRVYLYGGITSGFAPAYSTIVWDGTTANLVSDGASPDARAGHRLVTDSSTNRLLMLGGNNSLPSMYGYTPFEMWERVGGQWQPLVASSTAMTVAPYPPLDFGAAYDSDRVTIVAIDMFGTTEWDGQAWYRVSTSSAPSVQQLLYDHRSKRTLGVVSGGETWLWDGKEWRQATPAHPPKFHGTVFLASDPVNDAVLLFSPGNGTWLWDGVDWHVQANTMLPPANNWHIATDPFRRRVVLLRGTAAWEWNGAAWIQRTPTGPTPPNDGALGFDPELGRVVFFANSGSTFEYTTTAPSLAVPYGLGCAGSFGVPSMGTEVLPWRGDTARFVIDNTPGVSLGILGLDNTMWSGIPLPVDLAPAGMPGCNLYQSLDALQFLPQSTWSLAIPDLPSSVGLQFYVQALVPDAGAGNPFLATMSNALVNVIGEK